MAEQDPGERRREEARTAAIARGAKATASHAEAAHRQADAEERQASALERIATVLERVPPIQQPDSEERKRGA
jgi:hypothetical protein